MWKPTFKFTRGPMRDQVTSDRMNHILDGVKMAQPSASGHVGMTVNQTSDGWVAKVLGGAKSIEPLTVTKGGGLNVRVQTGKLITYDIGNADQIAVYDILSDFPQTNIFTVSNGTTEIWVEVYVNLTTASASGLGSAETWRWRCTTADGGGPSDYLAVVNSGSVVPTQTWTPGSFSDAPLEPVGYETMYVHVATVTAASGEITNIVQHFKGVLPVFFDASIPLVMKDVGQADLIFGNPDGTVPQLWERLAAGATGSLLTLNEASSIKTPAWLAPGSNGDLLTVDSGIPAWASKSSVFTEITVVTNVRENEGTLQKKTRTVSVLDPSAESDWVNA
jgi:hypothetical protein